MLALVDVVDGIYQHVDDNELVIGIYLDLQNAFDIVNHDKLLSELNLNIHGTRRVVHKQLFVWLSSVYICK
jgi:hypothetical protein